MTRIGDYAVERRLGGGGMAEVFLAKVVGAEGFSAPVAIKRVLPSFSDHPDFAAMFISEAKLSARLRHPNIVSVLDFKRDEQHGLFLVMELVEGKDLAQLLATGGVSLSLAIHITMQVLRGLGYAHHPPRKDDGIQGIVHRDISPQNILLSWEGEVKISDFGIAKSRESTQAAASIMIKGKPAYMSPEQADGRPLDGRSDLFAVGIMLWEMLAGQPLFQGGSTQEILAALLLSPICSPAALRPELPADVCAVAMRLLEKNAERRYATAEAAVKDLLACVDAPRDGSMELASVMQGRFLAPSQAPTMVAPAPRVRIGAPARSSATLRLGEWSVRKLWLLFVFVLLSATGAVVGVSALVTKDARARVAPTAPMARPAERLAPEGGAPVAPAAVPSVSTAPAMAPPAAPAAVAPSAIAPSEAQPVAPVVKRVHKKPPPAAAEVPGSGIVEVHF